MKKWGIWVLILGLIILPGCASEKAWTDYHSSVDKQTDALLAFAKEQEVRAVSSRTNMMTSYATSMNRAAVTPGATDDVLLAFAWGVEMGKPVTTTLPKLPTIVAPDKSSDLVRAWTPLAAMAVPFLYLAADGWGSDGSGTTIKADNGSRVVVDSQNAGSYNKAGGNQTLDTSQTNDNGSCTDCDEDSGLEVNPVTGDPEDPEVEPESCGESGGWYNEGTWWLSEGSTCSCASREAGRC